MAVLERELGINPLPETRAAYHAVLDEYKPSTLSVMGEYKEELINLPSKEVPFVGRELTMHHVSGCMSGTFVSNR